MLPYCDGRMVVDGGGGGGGGGRKKSSLISLKLGTLVVHDI